MPCEHEFWEREASVATEGYCPLCMAERIEKMREVLEWLDRTGGLGLDAHARIREALK